MGSVHVDEGKGPTCKLTWILLCPCKWKSSTNLLMQAKPTHQNIIRLAPPLVITEDEIKTALRIIEDACEQLPHLKENSRVLPAGEKHVSIGVDN